MLGLVVGGWLVGGVVGVTLIVFFFSTGVVFLTGSGPEALRELGFF